VQFLNAKRTARLAWASLVVLTWSLAGCDNAALDAASGFADITDDVMDSAQLLPTPKGSYEWDVAWLEGNQIAFLYAPEPSFRRWERQIVLYTLRTEEWRILQLPKPSQCDWVGGAILERLPNGKLGFVHGCHVYQDNITGEIDTLYMWNDRTDTMQALQRYPEDFHAGAYTLSPDMSDLIQESPVGEGLNNQMYQISQDGQRQRLFPNWQRVASPSWSPDGRTIAFVGTETYPGGKSDDFTTFGEIASLAYYPWNIYLMGVDGENVHIILSEVRGSVKWRPQSRLLSFVGTYKDQDGIWVLNLDTLKVTQIWPYAAAYDWSPDGQQMVVIERRKQDGMELTHPVIVDVPLDTK
jgi:hypothetical protein